MAEPSPTLTHSGVAVIVDAAPASTPVPPLRVALPAMHGDPKKIVSQIVIPAMIEERFATAQGLTVTDDDKELPVSLPIM